MPALPVIALREQPLGPWTASRCDDLCFHRSSTKKARTTQEPLEALDLCCKDSCVLLLLVQMLYASFERRRLLPDPARTRLVSLSRG